MMDRVGMPKSEIISLHHDCDEEKNCKYLIIINKNDGQIFEIWVFSQSF